MLKRAEKHNQQALKLVEKWKVRLAELDREGIPAKQPRLWQDELTPLERN